jgi:Mrp family chromosome partitioning ATPase
VPPQAEQELWTVPNGLAAYYESLRDHLLLAIKRTPGQPYRVGITGCQPSRSGTSVAGGVAVALARNGDGRVLMLNASALARPITADTWDQHAATGLLEVFADGQGRTTIIQPNLYVMAAQEVDSNQPRFTSARNLDDFVQQARASAYDFILFELPPMTGTSPGLRLAPLMDGVLLIVESEQTNRAAARETRIVLERIQANVIGAVVTDQKDYVPTWLHHPV